MDDLVALFGLSAAAGDSPKVMAEAMFPPKVSA